jgi:hypothetical protein
MTAQLTVLKRRPQLFVQWVAISMAWVELTFVANVQRCSPPERAVSQRFHPHSLIRQVLGGEQRCLPEHCREHHREEDKSGTATNYNNVSTERPCKMTTGVRV